MFPPQRDVIKGHMAGEIVRATVLQLVEEEGLLPRFPGEILVVDFSVGAADVRAEEDGADLRAVAVVLLGQCGQCCLADLARSLNELRGLRGLGGLPCADNFLPTLRNHRGLVADGILKLRVPEEAPSLPVVLEPRNQLLTDKLRVPLVLLEVLLEDHWVLLSLLNGVDSKPEGEGGKRELQAELLPPAGLDFAQQLLGAAVRVESVDGWGHRDARGLASLHVPALVVDKLLNLPRRPDVPAVLQSHPDLRLPLPPVVLEHSIDQIVPDDEVHVVALETVQVEVEISSNNINLALLTVVLLDPPGDGAVRVGHASIRLGTAILLGLRVGAVLPREVSQKGGVPHVPRVLHRVVVLAHHEPNTDLRGGGGHG
mmetsp:Transcript_46780/g.100288  ORF Transcript_46780/g.100288 Transcript_46780/m.100288 type:complete len:371 (-) Transcript_46780:38-1150(-)